MSVVAQNGEVFDQGEKEKRRTGDEQETKSRKCDGAYLALGFTANVVGGEGRPLCVLCQKTLAADSARSNKLRRHIETLHPSHVKKPLDVFQRKLDEYCQQESHMVPAASVNIRMQTASYMSHTESPGAINHIQ